jgi:hypothetical protein
MNISPKVAELVGGVDFDPDALHAPSSIRRAGAWSA